MEHPLNQPCLDKVGAILAVHASPKGLSVACVPPHAGQPIVEIQDPVSRGLEAVLPTAIGEVMRQADIAAPSASALLVTTGPGSFTNVRVLIAAAQAFSLATQAACFGVPTLRFYRDFALLQHRPTQQFRILLESRRLEKFFQDFDPEGQPLSPIQNTVPAKTPGSVFCDNPTLCSEDADMMPLLPSARNLAEWYLMYRNMLKVQDFPLRPLYVRPPDAQRASK